MIDINNIEELVLYVNEQLKKNRTMKDIEINDFKVNERVITKRLNRRGYKKVDRIFKKVNNDTTCNITSKKKDITNNNNNNNINNNIDMDKLKKLLDNLDLLLDLVNKKNNISNIKLKSNETVVTSLRINKQVYKMIKDRAANNNIKVTDIVNRALLDYLKNYI